ncbi:MAG TPA: CD1871A family CXXC motif-containing protein [Clostridia bacterium]|nr:CD1871A family CXXC motif-containing protein [Clostridia bacterium]
MKSARRAIPIVLLALGAGFLVLGLLDGEVVVVLSRAANICLECIGIG